MTNNLLSPIIKDSPFEFVAGYLCLDFVNTEIIQQDQRVDLLPNVDYLVAWLVQAQCLTTAQGEAALAKWGQTEQGEALLGRSITLRAMLRQMAGAIVNQQDIAPETIAAINALLRGHWGYTELLRQNDDFITVFRQLMDQPWQLLAPIAQSTTKLLTQADLTLVKRCDYADCIRYFYDTTRNHSRRWCSMEGCGNRVKVAAYYARKTQTEE